MNIQLYKCQKSGYRIPPAVQFRKGESPKCKTCHFYTKDHGCPRRFQPGSMDTACEEYERKLKF